MVNPPARKKKKYVIRARPAREERASVDLEAIALGRYARSRGELIAKAAYFLALARGFAGGDPIDDWLRAEAEIDARLRGAPRS